jgi:hypothetical protein
MPWVVVWKSRRGWTGRGLKWATKEKAQQIADDFNWEYNPEVFYKVVEVRDDYDELQDIFSPLPSNQWMPRPGPRKLPVHEPVTAKRKQEVYERQPSDEHENSLPDFERQGRERRVLNKPPTDKVNNRHTQHDDQKHDKLVDKAVSRSEVNRRQKVRYDK